MTEQPRPPRSDGPAAVDEDDPKAIKFIVFGGGAVMLAGLLMVLVTDPTFGAWGAIVMLFGGTVALVGKLIEYGRADRDPW